MKTFYIRAQRDGKWVNVDITELTQTELHDVLDRQTKERLAVWIVGLVQCIKENASESGK